MQKRSQYTSDRLPTDDSRWSEWKNNADPLRRQPNDHNFGSLIMLGVTAGAFLLVTWVAAKGVFFFLQESRIPEGLVSVLSSCV